MKSTRFDILISTYNELDKQLRALNYPELNGILESWSMSTSQMKSAINDAEKKIRPSQLVSGLEQGLNETPLNFSDLADDKRTTSLKVFYDVVESNIPGFFNKITSRLASVVTLGQIETEDDWRIIRNRIDVIEGQDKYRDELSTLYNLIGTYENAKP